MKHTKIFILFFFLFFLFFVAPSNVSAHILKVDGTIGAVLHVSPDDNPIAGSPTDFFFEIKDKTGNFTPQNCDCTASILQSGREIYSQSLFQNNANPSLDDASFSYNLPQKDIYSVRIVGKPKSEGAFTPFSLAWDIRVDRDSSNRDTSANAHWMTETIPYLLGIILFVIILVLTQKRGGGKKK